MTYSRPNRIPFPLADPFAPDADALFAPNTPETPPRPGPLRRRWDADLEPLWDAELERALHAASGLFRPDLTTAEEAGLAAPASAHVEEATAIHFGKLLYHRFPELPRTPEMQEYALLMTLWRLLRILRDSPTQAFIEDYVGVALRGVRRLQAGLCVPELCAFLYDYHRGLWDPHLARPQRMKLRRVLARTFENLPPDQMDLFWHNLQSEDPMLREAMRIGLEFLTSAHAVPHLLHGLEYSRHHETSAALIDRLEKIADPRAIDTLIRLRRETAFTDWTLSRQIARAVRVIEHQNRGQNHRTLLRPGVKPGAAPTELLRPAADGGAPALQPKEDRLLLRPTDSMPPDDAAAGPEGP